MEEEEIPFLHALLGPSVRVISITFKTEVHSSVRRQLVSHVHALCPNTKAVEISETIGSLNLEEIQATSQFVLDRDNWEAIDVGALNQAALSHLATMPDLKRLTLCWRAEDGLLESFPPHIGRIASRSLGVLDIEIPGPMLYQETMRLMDMQPIGVFIARIGCEISGDDWKDRLHELSLACCHETLYSVYLFDSYKSDSDFQVLPSSFSGATMAPLLGFRNLKHLHLSISPTPTFTDAELNDIALSLPAITSFSIVQRILGPIQVPTPTLSCLNSFVRHCHDLNSFTLAFNATEQQALPPHIAHPRDQYKTFTLNPLHSPIFPSSVSSTASYLRALLGHFEALTIVYNSSDQPLEDEWYAVETLLTSRPTL